MVEHLPSMHYALGFIFNNNTEHTSKYLVIFSSFNNFSLSSLFTKQFPYCDHGRWLFPRKGWSTDKDWQCVRVLLPPFTAVSNASGVCKVRLLFLSAKKCDSYFTSDTLKSTGCAIPFLTEDKCSSICLWFLVIKKLCMGFGCAYWRHICARVHCYMLTEAGGHSVVCSTMPHFVCSRQGLLLSLEFTRLAEGPECSLCLLSPAPLCLVLQELLDRAMLYVGSGTLSAGLHPAQQSLFPTNRRPSPAYLLHCEIFRTLLT